MDEVEGIGENGQRFKRGRGIGGGCRHEGGGGVCLSDGGRDSLWRPWAKAEHDGG